jgi:PAS domain S-box-containing protein
MTLRTKTLALVALTFLALVLLLYAMSQTLLLGGFAALEDRNVTDNAGRALNAVDREAADLNTLATDWSASDDSYRFAQDGNPEYVASNLTDITFVNLHLSYVGVVNNEGRIVYDQAYDLKAGRRIPPWPSLRALVSGDRRLQTHPSLDSSHHGLVAVLDGLFYLVARPIITSDGRGPIQGTFFFARALDDDAVARLAQQTQLSLAIRRLDDAALPGDFQVARAPLLAGSQTLFRQEIDDGAVAGYALLKSINGEPVALLRADVPRAIYAEGRRTTQGFTLLVLFVGAICAGVLMVALERNVLAPLAELAAGVGRIGADHRPSARVRPPGSGEFAALARQINLMLEALDRGDRALRDSEAQYRLLVERARDGIVITQNGFLKYANPRVAEMVGCPLETLVGQPLPQFIWPAALPAFLACREAHAGDPGPIICATSLLHCDGHPVDVELNAGPTTFDDWPAELIFIRDVTARRETEALAAEKERLAVTLRSIGEGVITTDVQGRVVLMNQAAEQLTGWSQDEAGGHPLTHVVHLVDDNTRRAADTPLQRVLGGGPTAELKGYPILHDRAGADHVVTVSASPIHDRTGRVLGAVLVIGDITDKRRMEQELLRAKNIESIGLLAGGIAHDFNNILSGILGNLSLARLRIPVGSPTHQALTEAEQATLRARTLTQQLLTFSRGGTPIKSTTSIAQVLRESGQFAVHGSAVRCEFALADDLWIVEADQGQLNQVIHNLMLNACQAMPQGGVITVRAENLHLETSYTPSEVDRGYVPPHGPSAAGDRGLPLPSGRYVKITIRDQGVGIPPEHLEHLFEPYFTTKEDGTGLGLATSYSIVRRHDGHIAVESQPGEGATFYIYLPAAAAQDKRQDTARRKTGPLVHGTGRVLVMDDEDPLREMAGRLLRHLGYSVDLAHDGVEALQLYRTALDARRPYDAVIMDLTVPGGMGGEETVRKLLEIDPNARAIVSSGYSADPVLAHFRDYRFAGILVKPYRIQDIASVLNEVLN